MQLYFKFVPVKIAFSLIAGVALILLLRKQVKAREYILHRVIFMLVSSEVGSFVGNS